MKQKMVRSRMMRSGRLHCSTSKGGGKEGATATEKVFNPTEWAHTKWLNVWTPGRHWDDSCRPQERGPGITQKGRRESPKVGSPRLALVQVATPYQKLAIWKSGEMCQP